MGREEKMRIQVIRIYLDEQISWRLLIYFKVIFHYIVPSFLASTKVDDCCDRYTLLDMLLEAYRTLSRLQSLS